MSFLLNPDNGSFKMEVSNSDGEDFRQQMVRMRVQGRNVDIIVRLPSESFGDPDFRTKLAVRLSKFAEWLAEAVE